MGGCFEWVASETLDLLERYPFPGNVRELQNLLERACVLADSKTLLPRHLPPALLEFRLADPPAPVPSSLLPLGELEARYLRWAAASFPGDRSHLAKRLGLSERTLYRKLQRARVLASLESPTRFPCREGGSLVGAAPVEAAAEGGDSRER